MHDEPIEADSLNEVVRFDNEFFTAKAQSR